MWYPVVGYQFDVRNCDACDYFRGRSREEQDGPSPDKKLTDRIHRMNEFVSARAVALASEHRPNFYQRARLANQVKWGLREAGYDKSFADTFTYELATLITVSARKPRKA